MMNLWLFHQAACGHTWSDRSGGVKWHSFENSINILSPWKFNQVIEAFSFNKGCRIIKWGIHQYKNLTEKDAHFVVAGQLGEPCLILLRIICSFGISENLRKANSIIDELILIDWFYKLISWNHYMHQDLMVGYSNSSKGTVVLLL